MLIQVILRIVCLLNLLRYSYQLQDYIIVLNDAENTNLKEYLNTHIQYLLFTRPEIRIKYIYNNLIRVGFIGYCASLSFSGLELLRKDNQVHSVELVSQFQIAANQPDRDSAIPFRNICKYNYDSYDRIINNIGNYTSLENAYDIVSKTK